MTRPIRIAEGAAAVSCLLLVVIIAGGIGPGPLAASLAMIVAAIGELRAIALKKL